VICPGNLKILHSLYSVLGVCTLLSKNHGYFPVQYELTGFTGDGNVFTARYEQNV
jgi:hypothetical protein